MKAQLLLRGKEPLFVMENQGCQLKMCNSGLLQQRVVIYLQSCINWFHLFFFSSDFALIFVTKLHYHSSCMIQFYWITSYLTHLTHVIHQRWTKYTSPLHESKYRNFGFHITSKRESWKYLLCLLNVNALLYCLYCVFDIIKTNISKRILVSNVNLTFFPNTTIF